MELSRAEDVEREGYKEKPVGSLCVCPGFQDLNVTLLHSCME